MAEPSQSSHGVDAQVMEQLLDNAAKYSPTGSLIEVTATSRGGGVLVSVNDQGIGIARGDQARLSEPFYQVSPMIYPTKRAYPATVRLSRPKAKSAGHQPQSAQVAPFPCRASGS